MNSKVLHGRQLLTVPVKKQRAECCTIPFRFDLAILCLLDLVEPWSRLYCLIIVNVIDEDLLCDSGDDLNCLLHQNPVFLPIVTMLIDKEQEICPALMSSLLLHGNSSTIYNQQLRQLVRKSVICFQERLVMAAERRLCVRPMCGCFLHS